VRQGNRWHELAIIAGVASILGGSALGACKKDSGASGGVDAEGAFRPKVVQENRKKAASLEPPAMLASIPADTPFVFAMFEPFPSEAWAEAWTSVRPIVDKTIADLEASLGTDDSDDKLIRALLDEVKGRLHREGLQQLGFSTEPTGAIYGIGLGLVIRFEVADGKRLREAATRVATKAGLTIPPPRTSEGVEYWQVEDDVTLILSVRDKEVVAAIVRKEDLTASLPYVLGTKQPDKSMKDGVALKKLAADYGFAPYGLGYVDFPRLLDLFMKLPEPQAEAPVACKSELSALAKRFPRFVIGYDEVTAQSMSMTAMFELAPDLAKKLLAIRGKVPGMSPKMSRTPLFAFGVGVDVDKTLALGAELGK
jgi:hypothetical protein